VKGYFRGKNHVIPFDKVVEIRQVYEKTEDLPYMRVIYGADFYTTLYIYDEGIRFADEYVAWLEAREAK